MLSEEEKTKLISMTKEELEAYIFQRFSEKFKEAMAKDLEEWERVVMYGTGTAKPLGILRVNNG